MMVLSTSGVVEAKESSSIPQNPQKSRIASGRSSSSSSHVTSTYVMPYAARRDLVVRIYVSYHSLLHSLSSFHFQIEEYNLVYS